jgi:hypothetical protein
VTEVVPILDRKLMQAVVGRAANWRGRSGRSYLLTLDCLEHFVLSTEALSVIARGNLILWVGSATDVINDSESRARFRLAVSRADCVFTVTAPSGELERATLIWDLEGAEPAEAQAA